MEQLMNELDVETTIGNVTLSNGQSLDIPKLSILKILKIVKFLGIDGAKLYGELREVLMDEKIDDIEKIGVILETLDEKQLVRIFSILFDLKDDQVLSFDLNEMLEILLVYLEKVDLKKTYSLIRQLMAKMFNRELPESMGEWFQQIQENRAKMAQMRAAAVQAQDSNAS